MKELIIIIIGICIFIMSCSKSSMKPGEPLPELEISETSGAGITGGDDDDFPIVMVMARDIYNMPVEHAYVLFIKEADTVSAVTDCYGACTSTLKQYGDWRLRIYHAGYQPVDTLVDVVLKESVLVKTLVR